LWVWLRVRYADFFGGVTEIGFDAMHSPAIVAGGKELFPEQFIAMGRPRYTYRKYYADGNAPDDDSEG
jgi:hypothetical protein